MIFRFRKQIHLIPFCNLFVVMSVSSLTNELLALLSSHDAGAPDDLISSHFGSRYKDLVPVINDLLRTNRLQLFTQGITGIPVYRAIKEETANKLEGLGRDQVLVYQVIEKAGNRGIWKQDIRYQTNLPQQALDKNIKLLEQRLLIKNVRSVGSKTKKLYMLYELAPAKEITGGPWYTDQEFDHEFVEALRSFILQVVCAQGKTDLQTISQAVKRSGISTVDLAEEELEMVLSTLIYDGKLEEVEATNDASLTHYRAAVPVTTTSVTEVPCGVCPLVSQCHEGGVISPASCQYMTKWLELADVPAGTTSELSW